MTATLFLQCVAGYFGLSIAAQLSMLLWLQCKKDKDNDDV